MTRMGMIAAAVLTAGYDLAIGWVVGFTLSWGGMDTLLKPSLSVGVFWVIAASPVVLTAYVFSRFRRIRRAASHRA